ncbi:hypothetical protein R1sor_010196 [Riccia sorocarpa]|uniref:Uncharacterized protein n=1 Tax=Riccia sorocarpa TaxID=122646 RepID=A0ABD3HXA4_9MARC
MFLRPSAGIVGWLCRQQVPPEHTQGILGKKASSKTLKGDDFVENGRRLVGDGFTLNEDKPSGKMPGGRLKGGSSTFHKDHKEPKDHKDHKEGKDTRETREHKEQKEHKDHSHSKAHEDVDNKAALESSENHVKEEEGEGQKRRAQEGERETLLQWGQRKRPRYREPPNGALKTSIRADRRVVRADKQIAAQPIATVPRGSAGRSSNGGTQELVSGSGKRIPEGAGASASAAQNSDHNHGQTSTGHLRSNGGEKDENRNHQHLSDNADKPSACPASTSAMNGTTTPAFPHGRQENESLQEKTQPPEKKNMDFFEWPKIILGLTRKEKEDDFMNIKGTKLPQRPKRRPKAVEKMVNFISPGTWLCDLTRERYEVREKKAVKKKPRGLKAMGSVDSDSE